MFEFRQKMSKKPENSALISTKCQTTSYAYQTASKIYGSTRQYRETKKITYYLHAEPFESEWIKYYEAEDSH